MPEYLNPPEVEDGYLEWFNAFMELSTERLYEMGPIPNSAIERWPVPESQRAQFRRCIRTMDSSFFSAMRAKLKADQSDRRR